MERMSRLLTTTAIASAALAVLATPITAEAKEYYEGKVLTILVPTSAGGGLDQIIRAFARHFSKNIPGNPTIVVKNMPGGGGTRSLNFLASKAKPDGMIMNWGSWNAAGVISKRRGIRFVPEKFGFIGAGGLPYVTLVRTDHKGGIKKAEDIGSLGKFNLGGRSADRSLDLVGNMSLQMMKATYTFVGGYRGMGKIKPALLAGEVQAANMGYIGYHLFFKDGIAKEGKGLPLWYSSSFDPQGNPIGNPDIKGIRPFHEVYKSKFGKLPTGPLWEAYKWYNTSVSAMAQTAFVAPGSPKEAVEALRTGYYKTANDPAYSVPEAKRIGLGLAFIDVKRGQEILNTYRNVSPKVFAELENISLIGIRLKKKGGKKKKK